MYTLFAYLFVGNIFKVFSLAVISFPYLGSVGILLITHKIGALNFGDCKV